VPERRRNLLERRILRSERRTRGNDQERRRHEQLREDDTQPVVGQSPVEQAPQKRVRTEYVEQQDPAHQRGQRDRELDHDPHHTRGTRPPASEQIRQRYAEDRDDNGREGRRLHGHRERRGSSRARQLGAGRPGESDQEGPDRQEQVRRKQCRKPR
jgi:hypothetical protein